VTSQREGQILGALEGIYGGVRYLGRKREFEECTRSNRRIREGISARYGRCGVTRTRENNVQVWGVTREVHSEDVI